MIRVPFWGYTAALDDQTTPALQDATLIQIASPGKLFEGAMERLGAEGAADAWCSFQDTVPDVRGQFR